MVVLKACCQRVAQSNKACPHQAQAQSSWLHCSMNHYIVILWSINSSYHTAISVRSQAVSPCLKVFPLIYFHHICASSLNARIHTANAISQLNDIFCLLWMKEIKSLTGTLPRISFFLECRQQSLLLERKLDPISIALRKVALFTIEMVEAKP